MRKNTMTGLLNTVALLALFWVTATLLLRSIIYALEQVLDANRIGLWLSVCVLCIIGLEALVLLFTLE
jgi:hypothetical protein